MNSLRVGKILPTPFFDLFLIAFLLIAVPNFQAKCA